MRAVVGLLAASAIAPGIASAQEAPSPSEVIAAAADTEWRSLDPENTVYFEVPGGRFVLELAPWAAPRHVENLKAMVRAGAFDGGSVVRSQDNYVAQWQVSDVPEGAGIAESLPGELTVAAAGLPFTPLADPDVYAPEAGFTRGFPVGRDPGSGRTWIAHCYGVVAVARGNSPDSGNAASLAAVTGHAPRHLDRNSSMVGRVVAGMEQLSTLPRGTGRLGFYETPEEEVPIISARVGSDVPEAERERIQLLRTDSDSFRDYMMAYRSRTEEWFAYRADRVDLCNVKIPARRDDR